jgi:hypothetical protein
MSLFRLTPWRCGSAALLVAAVAAVSLFAAPVESVTRDTFKDRKGFIPFRKYQSLPGKVVGILVSDVSAMMSQEGRGGPADAMGFSMDGGSYRWVYVPVKERPMITNLTLAVGEKGDRTKTYPSLSMASAETIKQWDIRGPYALVEVEVNDGAGAPADEAFTATKMRQLDGTREFSLNLSEVVKELRKRSQDYLRDHGKQIDDALAAAEKKALGDRKKTGPRETAEVFYLTWLPEKERLQVRFRTRITDGAYAFGGGAPTPPFPLPPPPLPPAGKGAAAPGPPVLRPPPPPPGGFRGARFGTQFGIEVGVAFEVTKSGKVSSVLELPIESFQAELPPPPGVGPGRGLPVDLPPPPPKRP